MGQVTWNGHRVNVALPTGDEVGARSFSLWETERPETRPKRDWMQLAEGILSGYPVFPIMIANRLGGSK
jgi:hypothetical protein